MSPKPSASAGDKSATTAGAPRASYGNPASLCLLVACALMLLRMARPLLLGMVPASGDLLHFHYPLRDFYSRALAAGQQFLWMPSLFNGFYVAGEGQLGAFHPFHWLLYRFVNVDTAFALEVLLPYPLMLAGMYLFLRRYCEAAPALFGSMLFAFCGFNLSHGVHVNMVSIVAHLPWLLCCIRAAFEANGWRVRCAASAAIGLLTGSQLLLGHPQSVWFSSLLEAAFALWLLKSAFGGSGLLAAAAVLGGKLLGLGIGAIQLLATWDAVGQSVRAALDESFATSYSLPPVHLAQLLQPYLLWGRVLNWTHVAGDEFAAYGGAVTLVLTAWWLSQYRRWKASGEITALDRLALRALIVGLLGLWLATGSYGGLYYVQTWLPLVGQFRCPARYLLFTQLALAIVATAAFARLLQDDRPRHWGRSWAAWCVAAASVLVTVFLIWIFGRDAEFSSQNILAAIVGPGLFVAAAGLLSLALLGKSWAAVALAVLAACDLALYGLGGVAAWREYAPRAAIITQIDSPAEPPQGGRFMHGQLPNIHTLAGRRMVDGYAAIAPRRRLNYAGPNAFRVAEGQYVQAALQEAIHLPAARPAGGNWYYLADSLPRARIVSRALVSQQPEAEIERIDVATTALAPHDLQLDVTATGVAQIQTDAPGDIRIQAQTSGRQLLIVSESFHRGWNVTVDGQAVPLEQINGDFIGCVLKPGLHDVRFEFSPAHLSLGNAISLLSIAVAVVMAAPWMMARYRRD